MKVTYTLKDLTEFWYAKIKEMSTQELFTYLAKQANGGDLRHLIKQKVGNGSFRDKVELNQLVRAGHEMSFKLEPRKGYKLATFEVSQ
jgi:hypothetical protein